MRYKDKTVVVTGGATGIGRAMCLRFAGEGAAVVVNFSKSRSQAEDLVGEIEGSGGRALAVQADVSRDSEARQLVSNAVDHFGRLDLLINNAGWTRFIPHHEMDFLSPLLVLSRDPICFQNSVFADT